MTGQSPELKDRLVSWEKLRWVYNGVMVLVGLPVAGSIYRIVQALPESARDRFACNYGIWDVVTLSIEFGVMANIAYFLGPVFEVYWVIFTRRGFGRWSRYCLFATGTLFSIGVQVAMLAVYSAIAFLTRMD